MERWACGIVTLHVKTDNQPAIDFYHRNGFSKERELVDFYWIEGIYEKLNKHKIQT